MPFFADLAVVPCMAQHQASLPVQSASHRFGNSRTYEPAEVQFALNLDPGAGSRWAPRPV